MLQPDALPQSLEAEQSLLGGLLIDGTAIDRITGLRPDHFAREEHRAIYQAILDCADEDGVIDIVTVYDRLQRQRGGKSENDAGLAYLGSLAQNTPSALNIRRYAELVRERALERDLLAALGEAAEIARNRAMPVREKLEAVQAKLGSVRETVSRDPIRLADALPAYREELQRRGTGESVALATSFVDLDSKLGGGLRPGELIIVAGRPSIGKSALAFQMAENVARGGLPVLVLSMEMSRQDVLDRAVAGESRIPLEAIRSGERVLEPNVEAALKRIQAWPLYIDDSPAMPIHEIRAKARGAKRRHGIRLLVLDYLQLMPGEGENRNHELAEITRGLKALAKELELPVVALSQMNRAIEGRAERRPQLSDLRDSGAIEQDADVVAFVHREEIYRPNDYDWRGKGEILIRKNRQGATGEVRMTWLGHLTRFENFTGDWPADRAGVRPLRRRGFGDD
jgi:replicative DNA helicase